MMEAELFTAGKLGGLFRLNTLRNGLKTKAYAVQKDDRH